MVGERQLFIRMGSCPFRCQYCDTPEALIPQDFCNVETPPTSRKFRKHPNPIPPEVLQTLVGKFFSAPGSHVYRAVTITGGEPLWQAGYLKSALPLLRSFGKRIYLETAGAHVAELQEILEYVDVVAMDVKPPSAAGIKPMWSAHRDFLKMALAKQVIIKVVVTRKTTSTDLERIRDFVAEIDRTVPIIIQPVTPAWKIKLPPTISQLLLWQTMFAEKLEQVRIIPQCHVALGDH